MGVLHKLFVSLFALLFICISSLSVKGDSLENVFNNFNKNAERATDILSKREASNESLSYLRADLFQDRNRALQLQRSVNSIYLIQKDELKLIDDLIAESSIQGTYIAVKRQKLVSILEKTTFELANTKLALRRAERLIKEIDTLKKVRFNERFFSFNQLVLFPITYAQGTADFSTLIGNFAVDFYQNFNSQGRWIRMFSVSLLPVTTFFIGLLILVFQNKIIVFGKKIISPKIKNKNVFIFFNPFLRLIAQLVGAALIINFLQILGGNYGLPILIDSLPTAALIFLIGYFLRAVVAEAKDRLSHDTKGYSVDLSRLKRSIFFISIALGFFTIISYLTERSYLSHEAEVTLNALGLIIIVIILNYGLRSMQTFISSLADLLPDPQRGLNFSSGDFIFKGAIVLTWVFFIVGIFGYLLIAFEIIKAISYIAGIIILAVLNDSFLRMVFFSEKKKKDNDTNSLFVIFSLLNFIGILLLLGLALGVEFSQYVELWVRFNEGLALGDVNLTPASILNFGVIFGLGYFATTIVQKIVKGTVLPKTKMDKGSQNAIVSGVGYVGYTLAAVVALSSIGFNLSSIAIVAGALSVGIGFGLQTIVSNFVSGIILLVERPIKEGDWIEASGFSGTVKKISVRSTQIETFDRAMVVVPNSELIAGSVLNWTHSNETGRVRVSVGVSYDTDPKRVERLLLNIGKSHEMALESPEPFVRFQRFGDSSLDFDLIIYVKDKNYMFQVRSELHYSIFELFKKEGIEIPFPQRDLNIKGNSSLKTNKRVSVKKSGANE
ncbi:MAG: mechanosensitive ion channel family protein [Paracoccaceae bacterium]